MLGSWQNVMLFPWLLVKDTWEPLKLTPPPAETVNRGTCCFLAEMAHVNAMLFVGVPLGSEPTKGLFWVAPAEEHEPLRCVRDGHTELPGWAGVRIWC